MLGITNLTDVAVAAVTVVRDVKEQLADGFQILTDIPVIVFKDFGPIKDIASKAKPALAEIRDLTPDELEEFEQNVAERTGLPSTGLAGKVRGSLRLLARAYRVEQEVVDIFHDAKELFAAPEAA